MTFSRGARRLLPAAASGVLLLMSFPPADFGLIGWIALVPLNLSLARATVLEGVARGLVCGAVFFGGLLPWIMGVLLRHSGIPAPLCLLPWLLLVGYLALYVALYGAALARTSARAGLIGLAFAPALWTGLEWARGTLLTGFPWGLLGASQHGLVPLAQAASVGGVYGLSFLMSSFSAAVAVLVITGVRGGRGRLALCVLIAIPVAVLAWGWHRLGAGSDDGHRVMVACVQGNSPPEPAEAEGMRILDTHIRLSREAAKRGAEIIVWAESSTPFGIDMDEPFRSALQNLARETGCWLIVGSVGGSASGPYYNGAFLIDPDGLRGPPYGKVHLVPYGEYVPLAELTPFVSRFVHAIGEFQPGKGTVVWTAGLTRLTPLICYEAIFPPLARMGARAGGEVLVNLTYDGWFGGGGGPAQHLALARMRAIETGRPLVRAAETGISAVFDGRGRLLGSAGSGTEALVTAEISPRQEATPYLGVGDVVPRACAMLSLILIAPLFLPNRKVGALLGGRSDRLSGGGRRRGGGG